MWKINRKYPLIELFSFLEYFQVLFMLFRGSKHFRGTLINSYKYIKNMQTPSQINFLPQFYENVYFKPDDPDKLFIHERQVQIYQKNTHNLKACIRKFDKEKSLQQFNTKIQFGKVKIVIDKDSCHNYDASILTLLQTQFGQFTSFEIYIDFWKKGNLFVNSIGAQQISNIEKLKLSVSQQVFLNVKCLEKVRHLYFTYHSNDKFNARFEDLSIPLDDTKFTIELFNPTKSQIKSIYSIEPNLLDIQCCNLILNCHKYEQEFVEKEILSKFPRCKIQIYIQKFYNEDSYSLIDLKEFQQQYGDRLKANIKLTFGFILNQFSGILMVEKLYIPNINHHSEDNFLCIESLSKFMITKEFKILIGQGLKVIQSLSKCYCPSKINIKCDKNLVIQWIQLQSGK